MSASLAAFINAGIAGAALTIAVWFTLSIAPRRAINAATRYAVWWSTLLVVVMLPVFYLPHRAVRVSTVAPIESATLRSENIALIETSDEHAIPPVPSRWPQFPLELSGGAWPIRIFSAWGIVALFMLLRLVISYVVLERRKLRARPAENLHRWPVRALISSDIVSPMAAGLYRPAILLPERLIGELDDDQLDQIRVHETAHLMRRDDIALLIQRTVEALFALHPVVRWITRRIDLEREIACDDFVVEQTGQARPYASCLTRVVEIAGGGRSSIVAAAATEERSHLARRIEMLLDKTRHTGTRLLKIPLLLMVAALLVMACVVVRTPGVIAFAAAERDSYFDQAPSPPEAPEAPEPPAPPSPPAAPAAPQSDSQSHRTITSRWNDGLHFREIRVRGDIHFTDDETDVKSMSVDGFFSYEESYGFSSRRFQVTADSSGQITRRYLVDGREKALDADGKAWLRVAIPDWVRDSGIDAPERVRRILKQGGATGVLAEIAKIHSDGTKKIYIRELVPIGNLSTDQFQSLLRVVRGMGSDGDKASVLDFLAPYTLKDSLRDYMFEALATVHSDGEKRRVLTRFILTDVSRGTLNLAARAATDISSDGEKAAVLVDLAAHLRGNSDLSHPFFRAAESIHSDGERARVLMAVIASAGEQRDMLVEAVRVAGTISSDGEKARVLVHADGYWKDEDNLRRVYFESARSVHSDGEKARVLTALVGRTDLGDRTLMEAVHCATTISSDGEKARVLVAIASHSTGKSEVRGVIKTAAASIHSDGEYRRVMTALDLEAGNVANRPQAR
jgi:beta-lactamase regulating signal transducer with metallopeptidase domain